jgi:hypothetical protein
MWDGVVIPDHREIEKTAVRMNLAAEADPRAIDQLRQRGSLRLTV